MATTIATTMAMLNAKSFTKFSLNNNSPKPKTVSLFSIQNLPKGLSSSTSSQIPVTGTAIAGAIFAAIASSDPAFAAQQIAEIAESSGDNRGLALLLPIIPAIAWVLFNILQPALNQINRMRNQGVLIGLGLGGFAASGLFLNTPESSAAASEIAVIADAASNDNRGQLLLIVVAPALLWVAYNILQPALNQLNRMRSE